MLATKIDLINPISTIEYLINTKEEPYLNKDFIELFISSLFAYKSNELIN